MDEEKVLNNSEQEKVDLPTENLSLPQQQDKNMGSVGIVVVGLFVVVIGVLGYLYFFAGKDGDNGTSSPTQKPTATPTVVASNTVAPTSTTVLVSQTPTLDSTANWNSFETEDAVITFKYPEFWTESTASFPYVDPDDQILIEDLAFDGALGEEDVLLTPLFMFAEFTNPDDLGLLSWIERYDVNGNTYASAYSLDTNYDEAFENNGPIYVSKDNRVFGFLMYYIGHSIGEEPGYKDLFDTILSTVELN